MLKYRIKNKTGIEITDTSRSLYKYIVFQYILPRPMFPPVKRMSKIYILNKQDYIGNLSWKYNLFNALICWLGLPFGPIHMIDVNKSNLHGGSEITEDIFAYITPDSIKTGYVILPIHKGEFSGLGKAISSEFKKVFSQLKLQNKVKVGYVKFKGKHHFYIGLNMDELYLEEELQSHLEKVFDNRSVFHFQNLQKKNELSEKLNESGTSI